MGKGARQEQTQFTNTPPLHSPAQDDLARLERLYALCRRDAVLDFLSNHQPLMALLLEAEGQIRARFPDGRMTLELVMDYDGPINDEQRRLVVSIATALEPERAVTQLNDLYASWWFALVGDARKWLAFSLEAI